APDDVAVLRQTALRVPHHVVAQILVLALRADAVELHTPRVGHEDVGVFSIVERVQINRHRVVAADLLAPGNARPDLGGLVAAPEDRVAVVGVVGEVDRGRLAYRRAVARLALAQVGDSDAEAALAR